MKILHLDSERTWRGGQNQLRLLIEGCLDHQVSCHLMAPQASAIYDTLRPVVPVQPAEFKHGMDFKTVKAISQYCREHGIDVIDAHSSKAHTLALFAIKHNDLTKLVIHRRVDYMPGKDPINQWKYRTQKVAKYIAISDAIGNVLRKYGIRDQRIATVRSAATPLTFSFPDKAAAKQAFAQQEALDPSLPWIGNASALTDQKDYPTLLRAVALLKRAELRFVCLIAGRGKRESSLRRLAQQLDIESHVRFLGFRDDVTSLLQALDVLAVSSAFEGLGTIILDGLQAGCCVVATAVGGIPEIIVPGQTGLLSKKGHAESFADNLKKAMQSPNMRNILADRGWRHVQEQFSVRQMIEGNISVYRSLFS